VLPDKCLDAMCSPDGRSIGVHVVGFNYDLNAPDAMPNTTSQGNAALDVRSMIPNQNVLHWDESIANPPCYSYLNASTGSRREAFLAG
jgi:hypothetical protein